MESYLSPPVRRRLTANGMLTPSPRGSGEDVCNGLPFSPAKSPNGVETVKLVNDIKLPQRYAAKCTTDGQRQNSQDVIPMDSRSREEDLEIAIKWLRREMIIMKKQDQALLRRFLDLRTAVVNIRSHPQRFIHEQSWTSLYSSDSDISLDDSGNDRKRLGLNGQDFTLDNEFRARTTSMLTPRNSLILTLKPRSKESF